MHREARDDVHAKRHDPQHRATMKPFTISPDWGKWRYEERQHSTNSWLHIDDQPHCQPDVCRHEGSKAENQERSDHDVLAGHARERSAQRAYMLPRLPLWGFVSPLAPFDPNPNSVEEHSHARLLRGSTIRLTSGSVPAQISS